MARGDVPGDAHDHLVAGAGLTELRAKMRSIAFPAKVALPQRVNPPPRTTLRNRWASRQASRTEARSVLNSSGVSHQTGGDGG
jgi:hypothetical protein